MNINNINRKCTYYKIYPEFAKRNIFKYEVIFQNFDF